METETRAIHNFRVGDLFDRHYRLLEHVGSGGFADVWKAKDELVDTIVALKIYTRLDREGISELAKEYKDMRGIKHPNLLTGNHFDASGNIPYLEMDYCDGGSLLGKMGRMTNEELRHVVRDIASGLEYLHKEGIIHQDIKPENILYDTLHDRYLLSDFGISSKSRTRLGHSVNKSQMTISMIESYAPPEKFSANVVDFEPDPKGDIFSLGITLFELATDMLPFTPPMATGREMLYSKGRLQLDYSRIEDYMLRSVVERCTKYNKEERPTAHQVFVAMLDDVKQKSVPIKRTGTKPPTEKIKLNSQNTVDEEHRGDIPQMKPASKRKYIYIAVGVLLSLIGILIILHNAKPSALTYEVNGVSFKLIRVDGDDSTASFYIGETEVTQALWQAVMRNNPSTSKGYTLPVNNVSWYDSKDFINKLNSCTGKHFRLPTASEWEYAAKGGNKSMGYTYSGSNDIDKVAWYWRNCGDIYFDGADYPGNFNDLSEENSIRFLSNNPRIHPVAQKDPNELGIYDMTGNVTEWCEDLYDSSHDERVTRGGSFLDMNKSYYVTHRDGALSDVSWDMNGFRLALSNQ